MSLQIVYTFYLLALNTRRFILYLVFEQYIRIRISRLLLIH